MTSQGAASNGQGPPVEGVLGRVRRWYRSRGRYGRLHYWLVFRGLPLTAAFGVLYAVNGLANSWGVAYDVALAIVSPREPVVEHHTLAWLLSLAGWLVAPGIAGAFAGYVIGSQIDGRRTEPLDSLFVEDGDD